jgi:formate dehydrogenase major subunit
MTILINGSLSDAREGERLIDVIGRAGIELPHVCYHPQLGPIQTCDTCLVELDGELVRACATSVSQDMSVRTATERAQSARTEAFDRILSNHLLYCTVCDNNNGNCVVHNTTRMLAVEHQSLPFKPKPYEVDNTNPFLPLRSRPVHSVRPLRRSLPESRGQRNAVHPLGGSPSAGSVGRRRDHR